MTTIAESARITTKVPSHEEGDIPRIAWEAWRYMLTQAQRKNAQLVGGVYRYEGTLRGAVMSLYPDLEDEQRTSVERAVGTFLRSTKMAQCMKTQNPTIWAVKSEWTATSLVTVTDDMPSFVAKQIRAEAKVTPEEAGETLPPGEVTVRHVAPKSATQTTKGTNPVTQSMTSEDRKTLITECLDSYAQPLCVLEIENVTGIEKSAIRKELTSLVSSGAVNARVETQEERQLRFNGQTRATAAKLYSLKSPVPERTEREAVPGFLAETNLPAVKMSTPVINAKLGSTFARHGATWKFTAESLAKQSGVPVGTLRVRLRSMTEENMIRIVGNAAGKRQYQVSNRAAILRSVNYAETPTQEVAKQPAVPAPPTATTSGKIEITVEQAAGITRLVALVETLTAENAELKTKLEELSTPKIDPAAAAGLTALDQFLATT